MSREQELIAQGFEKRTIYDEPRLTEIVEMYEEMGYEVQLVPLDPNVEPGCTECMRLDPEKFKVIFTRRKGD